MLLLIISIDRLWKVFDRNRSLILLSFKLHHKHQDVVRKYGFGFDLANSDELAGL